MARNIITPGVAFNLNDPDQKAMWDHAKKRTNFSAYVKRLIQRDMENGQVQVIAVKSEEPKFVIADGFY